MSVSQTYVSDERNVKRVLDAYQAVDKPTVQAVAKRLGTSYQNVRYIVAQHLSPEKLRAEKALRYSRAKTGPLNPMLGKSGSQHHNYIGDVSDGHGYLQRKVDGRYWLVHDLVMLQALGLTTLPEGMEVHHLDQDKQHNDLDNLALVTKRGHRYLHRTRPESSRSPLWAQWVSGTSKSRRIIRTEPTAS